MDLFEDERDVNIKAVEKDEKHLKNSFSNVSSTLSHLWGCNMCTL